MFKVIKKEIEISGKKLSLETGKIARQADGAIIAQCGETVILAVFKFNFFPLTSISFFITLNIYFLKFNFVNTAL